MRLPALPQLAAAAALLRLAIPAACFAWGDGAVALLTPDSPLYLELAASLAAGRGYVAAGEPHVFRPPGYPLLLVPGIWLGAPILFAVVAQAVLGALTCVFVHRAASELTGDERGGRVAALWVAVDPVLVAWSARLMAETGLALGMAAAAFGLVRLHGGARWPGRAWLAAGLAVAAAFKPIAAFVPAALFLLLLVSPPRWARDRRGREAILTAALPLFLLLPWAARNAVVAEYWGFSSQFDRILTLSAPAAVEARQQARPFSSVRAEKRRAIQTPGFERAYDALRRDGVAVIAAGFGDYARVHLAGMTRVLISPGAQPLHEPFRSTTELSRVVLDEGLVRAARHMSRERPEVWVTQWLLLPALLVLLATAAAGAWRGAGSPSARLGLAGLALGLLVLSGGPWSQSRFRAPLVPLLAVLSACALARPRGSP
ncbi:MAG: glycosyltransferase family 39 protein [Vicinamibacteria bacterium]|nr:glycosyltransferase family 39 protein [Vicinamibacteria bacterium]